MAEEHVRLTSAYFVPDERFVDLLCRAARRGVDVEVLVPGEHTDKRVVQMAGEADYEELLEAGIMIWRYGPTMLHAKVLSIDGLVATVGSANFDTRSLRQNEEANLVVFDPDVVAVLDRHFAEDVGVSEPVDPDRWAQRGAMQHSAEAATDLVDEQL
jgi:cardiolipin synthase